VTKRGQVCVTATNKDENAASTSGRETADTGVGLKAVWYAAETFGKIVGGGKGAAAAAETKATASKMSREEILAAIRSDYDSKYFVSGQGDMAAYAPDCEFADPFVAFKGTDRFKQNVGNLGGMMRDIKLDVFSFEEPSPDQVVTRWRFSCILDLPWKPLLAAAGSTTHVLDLASGRVVRHVEAWDVEPSKVVAQLFRPAAKVPSNAWETFLLAASDGDGKGMWYSVSPLVVKLSLPVIAVSLVHKLVTGEGLPGVFLGTVEGLSYLGFVSGIFTQVIKFAQGMQGGETGTGGRF